MLNRSPALDSARAGMVLLVALTGCAQIFSIDDWTDNASGTGGAGGTGQGSGQSTSVSASAGTGGQSTSQTSSVTTGSQSSSQSASSGTGGAQSSSQSASVGSGSGQGGSTMGTENCTNGVDDDNDGHIDCADSECTEFKCVPPIPTGWQGFVKVYQGDPSQVPSCGNGWTNPTNWLAGILNAPDAMCQCQCQQATGGSCVVTLGDDSFTLYNDALCTVFAVTVAPPIGLDTCYLLSTASITRAGVSYHANTPATGGSCAPMGTTNKIPPYFDQSGLMCAAADAGGGCANPSDSCLPVPNAPFKDSVCIYKPVADPNGTLCPTGYNKVGAFFQGISDQRACAPCTCGQVSGSQQCPMVANIYTSSSCNTNPVATLSGDGTCKATGLQQTATYYKVSVAGGPMGGQCPPSTPMPVGEASGSNGAVVCCLQ